MIYHLSDDLSSISLVSYSCTLKPFYTLTDLSVGESSAGGLLFGSTSSTQLSLISHSVQRLQLRCRQYLRGRSPLRLAPTVGPR